LPGSWRHGAARPPIYAAAWDEARRGAMKVLEGLDGMGDLLGVSVDTVVGTDTARADVTQSATFSLDLD
jgi:hypothetical protein